MDIRIEEIKWVVKDLIEYLPNNQLMGQWRECSAIMAGLEEDNLNHLLVNKVETRPFQYFVIYINAVGRECMRRGYHINMAKMLTRIRKYESDIRYRIKSEFEDYKTYTPLDTPVKDIYPRWHNRRYLKQCFYNLQEKHDCGGITNAEWDRVVEGFNKGMSKK